MRITSLHLQNFKRFTDLRIEDIPETAKLVLLIGANGSGKSSVFDAFNAFARGGIAVSTEYYFKTGQNSNISFSDHEIGTKYFEITDQGMLGDVVQQPYRFYGRPSIRIMPTVGGDIDYRGTLTDNDKPVALIDFDKRFTNDVFQFMRSIDDALRKPVFEGREASTLEIYQSVVQPLNDALLNVFGNDPSKSIQLTSYRNFTTSTAGTLIFKKGQSVIPYHLLSHGEKQVVILLLNFIVRKKYYEDAIIFIDEMDAHLNTSLQQALLNEIVARWIPDSSQFWTASHALGFIDYARKSPEAAIIDFDALDFDQPQIIRPTPKENFEVFEVAVSKEMLGEIFQSRSLVFAENTDAALYNNLAISPFIFLKANDKLSVFVRAGQLDMLGLIDRDYLSDEERRLVMQAYPYLRILPYYSSENLLYHPDNLEAYFGKNGIAFDKPGYIASLTVAKNQALIDLAIGLVKARDGYPFFKENEHDKKRKAFQAGYDEVKQMLQSDDFETFYKVFPAKDYGKTIPERQNLAKTDLAATDWFKKQIESVLSSASVTGT